MNKIQTLAKNAVLKGKRVLLRVDWNMPLHEVPTEGDLLKVERSAETIKWLKKQGAVTIVVTHLGRPKGREHDLSTVQLLPYAEGYLGDPIMYCGEDLETEDGLIEIKQAIQAAKNGSVLLLENVRFYKGEDTNDKKLAGLYASLADLYINDAFASCHRKHTTVSAVAKLMPHYAGPELVNEISAASKLLNKPKKPFVALIGGAKLSTKLPVLSALLKKADHVLIGGAMAHPFLKAKRIQIGKSYLEEGSVKLATQLIKNKKIILPQDFIVGKSLKSTSGLRRAGLKDVKSNELIGDIGPQTMQEWSKIIKSAQTILWNGPVGAAEITAFSHGSMVLGYAIASRARGKAYGIVGGGDTVPLAIATGMDDWFDYISTGGGALLEFISSNGKIPGITALLEKQPKAKTVPAKKKVASDNKKTIRQKSPSTKKKTVKSSKRK
jgi:phosphoglycerate kinase